ncbi:hypothetical protein E1A91_A03G006400v1 [Gossypium mustelinum]|uniref:Uncharacterized protein n=1 Tax=Gossypium mustelinum TaxID=34275 RepID=A0A5D2ZST3_GOSMU|nr:hypothetical protein E1A91_A03G006400v1 [Gossypium mustelinum]
MSLNCLNCRMLKRTIDSNNSRDHCSKAKHRRKIGFNDRARSEISPVAYEKLTSDDDLVMPTIGPKKSHHCRANTIDMTYGAVTFEADGKPRLVRSSGMRRDWSFENLRDENKRNEMRVH